jgi:hypothetical protein
VQHDEASTPEWVDEHFTIKVDAPNRLTGVRYVSAEAHTGYRYALVVTRLPLAGERGEGGPLLVTVTSPWIDAWALQPSGYLSERYVAEHLCDAPRSHSDADVHAITLLVRHALDRHGER